ncbi:hypothetical protein OOU_Y34scaffold00237g1 [Pyricularia oryzae Y34]|uniref:Uncharacterized protein n=2 Tax=Pyricularia oryzae TaxID=318829 RepID=A0AA97PPM1_PYRO3|nr:hypothetical protein OOU_Y34scaffold00237g1 [Pyricularia oryzae Y34]
MLLQFNVLRPFLSSKRAVKSGRDYEVNWASQRHIAIAG